MIVVAALRIAPVKALATVHRDAVRLTPDGVAEDRCLYLLDGAGRVVTMRRHPGLTRLVPSLDLVGGKVGVTLPDGTAVTSPLRTVGAVLSASLFGKERRGRAVPGAVADAISEYAGEPLTLVLAEHAGSGWDEGPVSVLARESVAAVGAPDDGDPPARFRMLLEVTGVPAYGEEAWVGHRLRVGTAVLEVTHPLGRCVVVDRSPRDGSRDWDGLHTLATLRGADRLDLGVIASVRQPGRVSVGDVVEPGDG